jgi:cytochrome b561
LPRNLKLVHVSLNYTMLGLVIIHAARAAIKHHYVDRDDVLRRMLRALRRLRRTVNAVTQSYSCGS